MFGRNKSVMVEASAALPGRAEAMEVSASHTVLGSPLAQPIQGDQQQAMFGLGCFWGAERKFWQLNGVLNTAVGYTAGYTPNPNYEEVCSGKTGHNEVVRLVYDPSLISYLELLMVFWQAHNPSQGMGQGNDRGTQYRSGIYTFDDAQQHSAENSRVHYQNKLSAAGGGDITTEIKPAEVFYFAEDYHQQYLDKNPGGYCGLGGTGIEY